MLVVAFGMTGLAGQRDPDLPELRRQGRVEDRLGLGLGMLIAPWIAGVGRCLAGSSFIPRRPWQAWLRLLRISSGS